MKYRPPFVPGRAFVSGTQAEPLSENDPFQVAPLAEEHVSPSQLPSSVLAGTHFILAGRPSIVQLHVPPHQPETVLAVAVTLNAACKTKKNTA
ncbi:MAG: hypothetical protein Q7T55_05770 [Solirubrobacteraceae bacterium]|nr:hypothetical protein [Solirubrobacteraceae bacterium]